MSGQRMCRSCANAAAECMPCIVCRYVARVLDTPLNWGVHSTALLVKSWLEFEGSRTAERAVLQMQAGRSAGHAHMPPVRSLCTPPPCVQALMDQHGTRLTAMQASQKVIDAAAPASDRLALAYTLVYPPRVRRGPSPAKCLALFHWLVVPHLQWELKRQCADRYRRLGVLRSALEIYEELGLWDDIIDCHVALEQVRSHGSPRCTHVRRWAPR